MKKTIKTLALATVMVPLLMLTSCNPIDDGSFVEPITLGEKVGGQWYLASLTQTDETTGGTANLTNVLNFDTFVINLNTDEANHPTTFSVDGSAPKLLPTSGTWRMDFDFTKSDGTASQVLLEADGSTTALSVTAVPGNERKLGLRLTRRTNGQPLVSYTYQLTSSVE